MALSDKQIKLAKRIDDHAKKVFAAGGDEEALLLGMSDFMSTFKQIMDSSSPDEMNQLCERFDGFYRFGKLLEAIAQGIQDGRIQVP
jgi:hypothetical protein